MRRVVSLCFVLAACRDAPPGSFTVDPTFRQEFFEQAQPAEADVLFVVDSSGSMQDEQEALAASFPSFVDLFVERGLTLRVAVTTTNIYEDGTDGLDGAFAGGGWLEGAAELADGFVERALVGIDQGHGDERGLTAAYVALAEPPPGNAGFLRESARLSVVVVSDEPDDSTLRDDPEEAGLITWPVFADWMESLKPGNDGAERAGLSAIVGIPDDGFDAEGGCGGNTGSPGIGALRGDGYLEAALATGGAWLSICTEDWSDLLARAGLQAAGQREAFQLAEVPDPERLEVRVDGDRAQFWTYRPEDNAVAFTQATAVPPPGAQIAVRYHLAE